METQLRVMAGPQPKKTCTMETWITAFAIVGNRGCLGAPNLIICLVYHSTSNQLVFLKLLGCFFLLFGPPVCILKTGFEKRPFSTQIDEVCSL